MFRYAFNKANVVESEDMMSDNVGTNRFTDKCDSLKCFYIFILFYVDGENLVVVQARPSHSAGSGNVSDVVTKSITVSSVSDTSVSC